MRHIKSIAAILLTTMMLSFLPSVANANGEQDSSTWGILKPSDMASYGEATISTPDMKVQSTEYPDAHGLEAGLTTAISVASRTPGDFQTLIVNESLDFLSPKAAQVFMEKTAQEMRLLAASSEAALGVLDETLQQTLLNEGVAAQTLHRVDEDGLSTFDVVLQRGASVAGIRIMVFASNIHADPSNGLPAEMEKFYNDQVDQRMRAGATMADLADLQRANVVGAELVNLAVWRLLSTNKTPAPFDDRDSSPASYAAPLVSPEWYGTSAASFWRHLTDQGQTCGALSWADNCHHLATWIRPYGNSAHFVGSGGDASTCSSSHGCISQWTWWLQTPESRLGVPKSFYFVGSGAMVASNYTASVWYD